MLFASVFTLWKKGKGPSLRLSYLMPVKMLYWLCVPTQYQILVSLSEDMA
ncbi:hypothetical protein [Rubripirellula lacrimiformis]|nr:hypothetical protein [Rubripirellula lacrimiformis]